MVSCRIGSICFGRVSVSGRRRVPSPPTSTTARKDPITTPPSPGCRRGCPVGRGRTARGCGGGRLRGGGGGHRGGAAGGRGRPAGGARAGGRRGPGNRR